MVINFITLFFVIYLHIKNKLYKFACIILKLNIMTNEFLDKVYNIYRPELEGLLMDDIINDYNSFLDERKSNFIPKKGSETLPSKQKRKQLRLKRKK